MAEKVVIISDSDKNKKTVYNCKGKTGVCVPDTYEDFKANAFKGARAVGSTMYITIHMCVAKEPEDWQDVELTFKNYTSIKNVYFLGTAKQNPVFPADYSTDPSYYAYIIDNLAEIEDPDKGNGTVVTGSVFADVIDMHDYDKAVTINALAGDDKITGTTGNDTITGGIGENIINYSKGDGNDIINLTAKEKLTIKMSDGENTYTIDNLSFEYANKNKDLIINTGKEGEFITLKNFAAKDVTGAEGSVKLDMGEHIYDLKTSQDITDSENAVSVPLYKTTIEGKAANFTGTWLADVIDAHGVDKEMTNKKDKHVNMVLNGGAGNDDITGSQFADTLTGGTGENTIHYSGGNDTVNLTKGEKLLINLQSAPQDYTAVARGKDLVLVMDGDIEEWDITDSITLKNFYKSNVVGANGSVEVSTDGTE
ncbi:MAG: hypothetical protein K6E29_04835, partial [Cyanobacteria bacterium RUI128]|nr:hypothetical protein [Cyanobacteria bacterium RUI128]